MATNANKEKGIFTVEFPLITEPYQEDVLAKRMELARRVYNQTLRITLDRYEEAMESENVVQIKQELKEITKEKYSVLEEAKKQNKLSKEELSALETKLRKKKTDREKELYRQLNQVYFDIGISKFGVPTIAIEVMKKAGYNKKIGMKGRKYQNLDSTVTQKIGDNLYAAWQKKLFGNGEKLHFKKAGSVNTLSGKNNKTGIMIRLNRTSRHWAGEKPALVYNGLEIPIKIKDNFYEQECFYHDIAYSRIVRRKIKNKDRYFVQILFRGVAPKKIDMDTGEVLHPLGSGVCYIAVGIRNIAVSSEQNGFEIIPLNKFAPSAVNNDEKIAEIQCQMDSSRRATNPDRYNDDGTIKENVRKRWVNSTRYLKLKNKYTNTKRKESVNRKISHYKLANYIMSLGDEFYMCKLSYKEEQQRTKDKFVKIPKSQLIQIDKSDAATQDAFIIKIKEDVKEKDFYKNVIVSDDLFLQAKKKKMPVVIQTENNNTAYLLSAEDVQNIGAHTHKNKGKEINANAPSMFISLFENKVKANSGDVCNISYKNIEKNGFSEEELLAFKEKENAM